MHNNKIISLALAAALLTPMPALARNIRLKQKTNDGSTLIYITNYDPVSQSGWTVFKYAIEKENIYRENIGVTPYCSGGKIKRDEIATTVKLPIPGWADSKDIQHIKEISRVDDLSGFIKQQGWIVDSAESVNVVVADSAGSKTLLSSVCSMVR